MHAQLHFASVSTLLLLSAIACTAQTSSHRSTETSDAAWAKIYATDCGAAMKHRCPPSTNGYENEFNGDSRLPVLLKRSLRQRESWWVNGYGGSAPVSSIVREFIGVPKDLFVDDHRYVTATGCVPRDCTDGGMLWIDTDSQPATVVFVAHTSIESFKGDGGNHLWLYTSKPLNFESLPTDLLSAIARWHSGLVASWEKLPKSLKGIFSQQITVATLVQPNGRMHDLTYDMLFYKQNQPHFPQPGATQ